MSKDKEWWSDFGMLWAFSGLCFALEDAGRAVRATELRRGFNDLHEAGYTLVEIFIELLEEHDGTYGDGSDGFFGPNVGPIKVPPYCQRFRDSILREVQARIAAAAAVNPRPDRGTVGTWTTRTKTRWTERR